MKILYCKYCNKPFVDTWAYTDHVIRCERKTQDQLDREWEKTKRRHAENIKRLKEHLIA